MPAQMHTLSHDGINDNKILTLWGGTTGENLPVRRRENVSAVSAVAPTVCNDRRVSRIAMLFKVDLGTRCIVRDCTHGDQRRIASA